MSSLLLLLTFVLPAAPARAQSLEQALPDAGKAAAIFRANWDDQKKAAQQAEAEKVKPENGTRSVIDPLFEAMDVPVSLMGADGYPVTSLISTSSFHIYEDGVEQKILQTKDDDDGPMTTVLLIEWRTLFPTYSYTWYYLNEYYLYMVLNGSMQLVRDLTDKDRVAVVAYSWYKPVDCAKKPEVDGIPCSKYNDQRYTQQFVTTCGENGQACFTNRANAYNEMSGMRNLITYSREGNFFDTLLETMRRMDRDPSRKSIIMIGSGLDTFSNAIQDQVLEAARKSHTTLYALYTAKLLTNYLDSHGALPDIGDPSQNLPGRMDLLQGENVLKTLAKYTGGDFYDVQFEQEFPDAYGKIFSAYRSQYVFTYMPSNKNHDGKVHKIEVKILDDKGQEIKTVTVQDSKHHNKTKDIKFKLYAPEGRKAPSQ